MQRFRYRVHVQGELNIPEAIAHNLAVGLHYISPRKINSELPLKAWLDFERRLHWNYYFKLNPKQESGNLPYDPNFDVRKRLDKTPGPIVSEALEQGLAEGQSRVTDFRPDESTANQKRIYSMDPHLATSVQEWVTQNRVIITQTNKNLGIAVINSEWYQREIYKMLNNPSDYRPITMKRAFNILFYLAAAALDILREWDASTALPAERQLRDFLFAAFDGLQDNHGVLAVADDELNVHEQCCKESGLNPAVIPSSSATPALLAEWHKHIPLFYGIPKIHKNPWKLRPIMPCHSTVIANFSKVLSKLLKLIMRERPYVLESSHALCQDLRKVDLRDFSLSAEQNYYIITGDIVAYYPNVPVAHTREIVTEMWLAFIDTHTVTLKL